MDPEPDERAQGGDQILRGGEAVCEIGMSLPSSTSSNVADKTDGSGGSIPRTKTAAILNKWGNTSAIPNTQRQNITSNSKSSLLTGKLSRLINCSMGDDSAISVRASKTILQRLRNMLYTGSTKRARVKEFVAWLSPARPDHSGQRKAPIPRAPK